MVPFMAMTKCPECKKKISTKAESCPKCGSPITEEDIKQHKNKIKKKNYINIIALIIVFFFFIKMFQTCDNFLESVDPDIKVNVAEFQKNLKQKYFESFGGSGIEKNKTSFYDNVLKLEVSNRILNIHTDLEKQNSEKIKQINSSFISTLKSDKLKVNNIHYIRIFGKSGTLLYEWQFK